MYWILRLIPSRVSEVTAMAIDCLRPLGDDYILTLIDHKDSGSPYYAKNRLIHLKYKGMGKYLIDLIKEQQIEALSLQKFLAEKKRGLLFTSRSRVITIIKAPNIERIKSIKPKNHQNLKKFWNQSNDPRGSFRSIVYLFWYRDYVNRLIKNNKDRNSEIKHPFRLCNSILSILENILFLNVSSD